MSPLILILIIFFSIYFLIRLEIYRERNSCNIKDIFLYTKKHVGKYSFLYISDFHNTKNKMCISQIKHVFENEKNIDDIISGGDMVTYSPKRHTGLLYDNFIKLLDVIKNYRKKFYFGYGNHENRLNLIYDKFKTDIDVYNKYQNDLSRYDIHYINNNTSELIKNIRLCEIRLPIEFYKKNIDYKQIKKRLTDDIIHSYVGDLNNDCYNIVISHNPDYCENLIDYGFDLVLSGHQHGGLIRLPFVGSVFSPEATIFPPYNKGHYQYKNKDIVVSSGMGEHTVKIRLNNKPEIYKIHIKESNGNDYLSS